MSLAQPSSARRRTSAAVLFAMAATLALHACGGGGGSASGSPPADTASSQDPAPSPPTTPPPAEPSPPPPPPPSSPPPPPPPAAVRDTTPVAIVAQAGAAQSGFVNQATAVAPAVRITARDGGGVAGVTVTFSVLTGGGSVQDGVRTTDADGVATVGRWTLGPTVGLQKVVTRTSGLPEITFTADALPSPGSGVMTVLAGTDHQTAEAGTALPVAPAVRLLRVDGTPHDGVAVHFTVATGGGSVTVAEATTGADGVASAGRWTLGTLLGSQTLVATAPGYAQASFVASAFGTGAPTFTRSVWLSGLDHPWDIAFAPDGAVLFTERSLGLSVRLPDGTVRRLFAPADLAHVDQDGMLGLALDPQFASNRTAYVYLTSNIGGATDNRIVRFVVDAGYTAVSQRTDIVTGIRWENGEHQGGRIRFGPDGLLYITTGDNREGPLPQDPTSLAGKVLRVTRDGAPAPGNVVPAGGDPRLFTVGHRNPQGVAFRDRGDDLGRPYLCEHGPGVWDEVTPLANGGNGGWDPRPNAVTGRCPDNTTFTYCGYSGTDMTDLVLYPGALRPLWRSTPISQGLSGCGFVSDARWRDWDGALAVALLSGRRLEVLRLSASGALVESIRVLDTLAERLRHVETGPDGALWVLTDARTGGDEIWRLVPGP